MQVAIKMERYVCDHSENFSCSPEEAFIIGYLHDVGYEFTEIQTEHAKVGGEKLKEQGYKYWREIYYHGFPQREYNSPELRLLNYIDMTTGPSGEDMTVQQRIEDIGIRYGENSIQVIKARELLNMIDSYVN